MGPASDVRRHAHLSERTDLVQVQHLESSVDYRTTSAPEGAFCLPGWFSIVRVHRPIWIWSDEYTVGFTNNPSAFT